MNNPMLLPLLCIVFVFAVAFFVWGYFAIKSARRERGRAEFRRMVEAARVAEWEAAKKAAKKEAAKKEAAEEMGERAERDAPLYRHRGHRHAKRAPNRADRRAVLS